jgi:hypothetical protein
LVATNDESKRYNPLIRNRSLTEDAIETDVHFYTSNSKVALQPLAALA